LVFSALAVNVLAFCADGEVDALHPSTCYKYINKLRTTKLLLRPPLAFKRLLLAVVIRIVLQVTE